MGTNYYAYQKISPEFRDKIVAEIDKANWGAVHDMIPHRIHIGKSSFGWAFCFNHNNWEYFEKSIESLEIFLKGVDIYDEYNTLVSEDEFWDMVKGKENGKRHLMWMGQLCGTMEFGLNFSTSTIFS